MTQNWQQSENFNTSLMHLRVTIDSATLYFEWLMNEDLSSELL